MSLANRQIHPNPEVTVPASERLRHSAYRLFAVRGADVTLREIAADAETNEQTAKKYYGDRDGLLHDYVRVLIDRTTKLWQDAQPGPKPASGNTLATCDWIDAVLRGWIGLVGKECRNPDSAHCQLARISAQLAGSRSPVIGWIQEFRKNERDVIKSACDVGLYSDPESLSDLLVLLVDGARNERQILGYYGATRRFAELAQGLLDARRLGDEPADEDDAPLAG